VADCVLGLVLEATDGLGAFVVLEVVEPDCLVEAGDFSGLANAAIENRSARNPLTATKTTHVGILPMIAFVK